MTQTMPDYRLEWIEHAQMEEWRVLFNEVYGSDFSPARLEWKYRDADPLGIGLRRNGKLVAFYGGMPREGVFDGKPIPLVQMGDVMVHPGERGAFTRKGAFWKVAEGYIGSMVGEGKPYSVAFGFPNRRAYLLGHRLNLYDAVDRMEELSWKITKRPAPSRWKARDWSESDETMIQRLWKTMSESLAESIVGVRDEKWLNQRYLNHPDVSYRVLVIHSFWNRHNTIGIVIVRDCGSGNLEWVDLIGDVAMIPAFWKALRHYAYRHSFDRVFCWITHSHTRYFGPTNPYVHDIDIVIPFNILTKGVPVESVCNRWWLMAGDTDFR